MLFSITHGKEGRGLVCGSFQKVITNVVFISLICLSVMSKNCWTNQCLICIALQHKMYKGLSFACYLFILIERERKWKTVRKWRGRDTCGTSPLFVKLALSGGARGLNLGPGEQLCVNSIWCISIWPLWEGLSKRGNTRIYFTKSIKSTSKCVPMLPEWEWLATSSSLLPSEEQNTTDHSY